jgi:hypothetical protein
MVLIQHLFSRKGEVVESNRMRTQQSLPFDQCRGRRSVPEREQVWSSIIVADPNKYGGTSGLMYEIALKHLHRIDKSHPQDGCRLCKQERRNQEAA